MAALGFPSRGSCRRQPTDEVASYFRNLLMAVTGAVSPPPHLKHHNDSRPTSSASHPFGTFPSRRRLCILPLPPKSTKTAPRPILPGSGFILCKFLLYYPALIPRSARHGAGSCRGCRWWSTAQSPPGCTPCRKPSWPARRHEGGGRCSSAHTCGRS